MPKAPTRQSNTTVDGYLACAYGEPWLGAHFICAAAVAATCGVPVSDVQLADYSHLMPKLLTDGKSEPPQEGWLF
jgi:hypothetical protein